MDSYGGSLKYKVSYLLQRDGSEPVDKPDVVLRGNGNRLVSRLDTRTKSNLKNEREVKFTEVSQSRHLTHLCINVAGFCISCHNYSRAPPIKAEYIQSQSLFRFSGNRTSYRTREPRYGH